MNDNGGFNHNPNHIVTPTPPTPTTTSTTTTTAASSRLGGSLAFKSKHRTSETYPFCIWSKLRHKLTKLKFKLNPRLSDCGKSMKVADFSLDQASRMRKLKGHHLREELQGERMHEILHCVHDREDGKPFSIPNFVPSKMKELLAELAMVDDEIVQLESQIQELQLSDVKQEQEVITRESKSKLQAAGNSDPASAAYSPAVTKTKSERIRFDTKALHFINKAINGNYHLRLSGSINGKGWQQENNRLDQQNELAGLRESRRLLLQRSGTLNPAASPSRDIKHIPTPKTKERSIPVDLPRKSVSNTDAEPASWQRQKWEPNKLSESILKCLILIYVRLIRTWRQVELERGGHISRSMHSSHSFRAEGDGGVLLKEKQKDPYGILKIEHSTPRDIGPYKNLLVFTSSSLNPKCISTSNSIPLFQKLRGLLNSLQKVDVRSLTEQQKLAFWINIYNACIMNGYLQYGAPSSPEKLLAMVNKATFNVGGNVVNAPAIEQYILRKPPSPIIKKIEAMDKREVILRELYGLESSNPNIIFALSGGNRSSPAVRIYTAEGLVGELERSKIEYLQASITVTSTKIVIPELLIQNSLEFAEDFDSLVQWICHQLPTSGSLRKSIVDCFRSHNSTVTVDKLPYELEFQYLLAP
ncbi:hypothetical protein Dimus_009925 [Dionaea muscipula]